ncbi:MAG: DUF2065 domain-containing protein [Deltaproteobacteria bacterium]|nr:DUF2065 domain-containing protein [Deltaproteobacteria bacterium]
MKYFLSVLGMVLVVEGLPYFAFPERVKDFLSHIVTVPDRRLRVFGLIIIGIGLLILYVAREMG